MNVGIDYDDYVKKENTSDRISGVEVEEETLVTGVAKKMKWRDAVRKIIQKKVNFPIH